jgi:hypothetical protein
MKRLTCTLALLCLALTVPALQAQEGTDAVQMPNAETLRAGSLVEVDGNGELCLDEKAAAAFENLQIPVTPELLEAVEASFCSVIIACETNADCPAYPVCTSCVPSLGICL